MERRDGLGFLSKFIEVRMSATSHMNSDVVVIRPPKGMASLDLKLLWQFRDLLRAFAERDIRLRYRQTVLGAAWVILQPLLGAGIFSIVFGMIAKLPTGGLPYFLISYAGFLSWTLVQGIVTRVSPSLLGNAPLIRKVFFPRLLAPFGAVPSVLVDFVVALGLMVVLMIVYRVTPGWGILLMPLCLLILLLLSFGIALIASTLMVKYRDIQHIVPFGMQLLMYASPVGYTIAVVPEKLRTWYFLANPFAVPIDAVRSSLLGGAPANLSWLAYSAVVSVVVFAISLMVFHSYEREFADVI